MIHATFTEENLYRLCDFLRNVSEKNSGGENIAAHDEGGSSDEIFIVKMEVDDRCFKLHIKPAPPNHIAITEAFERNKKGFFSKFVPVTEKSVLFSLLHIYLFKTLQELGI